MAFNFKNLEEYYDSGRNRKNIVTPMPSGPNHSTTSPVSPFGVTPEKSTQEPIKPLGETLEKTTIIPINPFRSTPNKTTQNPIKPMAVPSTKHGALLKIYEAMKPSDRKQIITESKYHLNHMLNNQSGFLEIAGKPGEPMHFKFMSKTPAGGTSYQTVSRFGYNKQYTMKSSDGSNWDTSKGEMIPEAALSKKKGNLLDSANKYYEKIGIHDFKNLRAEAERNNPRTPMWLGGPLIQRGIQQGPGNDNPEGSGGLLPSTEMINKLTAPIIDTARVAKWLVSPKGLLFNLKQFGLQLTNPRSEWKIGLHRGRIYNPLALALQVPLNALGIHIDRHYLGPLNAEKSRYEKLITDLNKEGDTVESSKNRLAQLHQEMNVWLGGSESDSTSKLGGILNSLSGRFGGAKIKLLSGLMGPKSLFGIGQTRFFKHTSGNPVDWQNIEQNYSPYGDVYLKGLASGEWSEASKADEGDIKAWTETNHGNDQTIVARKDFDTHWSDKVKDEVKFPEAMGLSDPKGEAGGLFWTMDYAELGDFRSTKKIWRDFRGRYNGTEDQIRDFENSYGEEDTRENAVKRLKLTDWGAHLPGYGEDDLFEGEDAKDYVKVKIEGTPKTGEDLLVTVRGYNLEITDKLTPSYTSIGYSGNPAESHIFEKIGRDWTLKFTLAAFSSNELINNYKKLNNIMRLSSPKIIANYAGGQINKITVGDIWIERPIIISACDYTFQDAGWDIGHGVEANWDDGEGNAETTKYELPIMFDVSLGGKFLVNADDNIWSSEGTFFDTEMLESTAEETEE